MNHFVKIKMIGEKVFFVNLNNVTDIEFDGDNFIITLTTNQTICANVELNPDLEKSLEFSGCHEICYHLDHVVTRLAG